LQVQVLSPLLNETREARNAAAAWSVAAARLIAKVVDEAGKEPECRDDPYTEKHAEEQIRE
jgi:hypothetical protein